VGQETFHVHLLDGQRLKKAICQSNHKKGKHKQAFNCPGKAKFESYLTEGKAQNQFFA